MLQISEKAFINFISVDIPNSLIFHFIIDVILKYNILFSRNRSFTDSYDSLPRNFNFTTISLKICRKETNCFKNVCKLVAKKYYTKKTGHIPKFLHTFLIGDVVEWEQTRAFLFFSLKIHDAFRFTRSYRKTLGDVLFKLSHHHHRFFLHSMFWQSFTQFFKYLIHFKSNELRANSQYT